MPVHRDRLCSPEVFIAVSLVVCSTMLTHRAFVSDTLYESVFIVDQQLPTRQTPSVPIFLKAACVCAIPLVMIKGNKYSIAQAQQASRPIGQ